ncbi:flagellar hook-basal body complex protein FliE [Pseudochelatococcus sp. B33]
MVAAVTAIDALQGGVAGLAPVGGIRTAATAASAVVDFASVLGSLITDTAQSLRASEAISAEGLQGRASTQAVVESIMEAERSLQTTLAVRDKVVAAYQEISRMAI